MQLEPQTAASALAEIDADVVSKGEFARRRGVTPARVSQWLADGKIDGDALVGDGRFAQIRESVAVEQLRLRLDAMQMTGNGLTTRLVAAAPTLPLEAASIDAPIAPTSSGTSAPGDAVEDRIKLARLEEIERRNRAAVREEALAAGRLTDAETARKEAGRQVAQLVAVFEGALSDMATAIAAEFKLPQRDVVHLLRKEFRKVRGVVAVDLRTRAAELPEQVELVDQENAA